MPMALTEFSSPDQSSAAYNTTTPRPHILSILTATETTTNSIITTVIAKTRAIMPVHPSEEQAPSGIYDQIAKDPTSATDSTASDHPLHQGDKAENGKATAQDFQSKGPAIPQSMNGQWH